MNRIWDILHIEATTDKREIKKAYARRTKEIHPEEKPEEFQMLHEAYQKALQYASFGGEERGRQISFEMPQTESENGAESEEAAEKEDEYKRLGLDSKEAKKEQRILEEIEYFQSDWEKQTILWGNNGLFLSEAWKQYLQSDRFRRIMRLPVVLETMVPGIKRYCLQKEEILLFFWDLYGFENSEERRLEGAELQLYRILYPAYVNRVKRQQYQGNKDEIKKEENKRIQKLLINIVCAVGGMIAVVVILAYFKVLDVVAIIGLLVAVIIFSFWVTWRILRG